MITRTVKIPKSLADKIDMLIENEEYSTRADFILHAMRHTLNTYVMKKMELYSSSQKINITEKQVEDLYSSMTKTFLNGFDEHQGELVQVNTRVPEGLERKTLLLIKQEYGLKKKADFTRASIMCLLSALTSINDALEDAEKLAEQQKTMTAIANQAIIEGLSKGMKPQDIIEQVYGKLKEKMEHKSD